MLRTFHLGGGGFWETVRNSLHMMVDGTFAGFLEGQSAPRA
jgi:hypothetical protein